MKKITNTLLMFLFCTPLFMASCKKDKVIQPTDDVIPPTATGTVTITFEHVVGTEPLQLDTKWYTNQNADSFTVSIFRYYISNVQLIKTDGTVFSETESYHLVDQGKSASREFTINNVPSGDYTGIRFLIGVDSTRNVSGAKSGALDPANEMFWTWQSGYIMAKMEGQRPKLNNADRYLTFHIGGFSGQYNTIRKVNFSFNSGAAKVNATAHPVVALKTDLLEWFKTPNIIKFDEFSSTMMPGPDSKKIADNYSDMFTITSIQN